MDEVIHRFFLDLSAVVVESTSELSILFLILLLFVIIVLIGFYVYNRTRKLNKLDRQIPASLVRSYLNSIIRNSSELKDSLFLEEGQISTGEIKNDILALQAELKEKEKVIEKLTQQKTGIETAPKQAEGVSPILMEEKPSSAELEKITKERDDLLLRISDYQKAEEDFANLKKLKEENEELKKKLGIDTTKIVEEVSVVKEEVKPVELAQVIQLDQMETKTEEVAQVPVNTEEIQKEEKSAEDLLREFEKMLG